jgi:ferredoxin-thioredoxin reductase catalytic subunit
MPTDDEVMQCIEKLRKEGFAGGYNLNPNLEDLKMVIEGYLENQNKYGYPGCPCRLNSGNYEDDKDIVCPCDYRDDDIVEFGSCYCSLYVDDKIAAGKKDATAIPDRRPAVPETTKSDETTITAAPSNVSVNVWRCPVCGYLAAKDQPPPKCPICGASRDRFELFIKAG